MDGHNDNGWDQGLVFMDNDSTWFQPPAYVIQKAHDSYQPNLIGSKLDRTVPNLNYVASRSDDGGVLTLKFTNSGNEEIGLLVLLKGGDADMDHPDRRQFERQKHC